MASGDVVMLEFNELTASVMDRFIDEGRLPAFERFRNEAVVALTQPDEPQHELNPWVQWLTVHTGVSFAEHQVFKLGDGAKLTQPTIADVVAEAGDPTWICGSMNQPFRPRPGASVPDPWNPDPRCQPAEFEAFATFVRAHVQEHSNPQASTSAADLARFGWFMMRHGLSARTVRHGIDQLLGERRSGRASWARATTLDRLGWDLFWNTRRRTDARFSTFFSNSTAHFQHVFWRNFEPEKFEVKPTDEQQRDWGDAVAYGFESMDRLVAEALDRVDDDTTLVLCTALGQQPYLASEASGGKRFHRPFDIAEFVRRAGIEGVDDIVPVMSEEFHLHFGDERVAERAADALTAATIGGRPGFSVLRNGTDVLTGCAILDEVEPDAEVDFMLTDHRFRFGDVFYAADTSKSGYHHPHGMLWVRRPDRRHAVIDEPVPLRSVAPTVLSLLDLPVPETMHAPPVAEMVAAPIATP